MKGELFLKVNLVWAIVAVYAIFALKFELNGTLFLGVLAVLGAAGGVELALPKIAAAKRAESIVDPPEPPKQGG